MNLARDDSRDISYDILRQVRQERDEAGSLFTGICCIYMSNWVMVYCVELARESTKHRISLNACGGIN